MEMQHPGFNSGTLLFFETVSFTIIWWFSYLAAEPIFRRVSPDLHSRLAADRERKLVPFILFALRIFYGLAVTFPACAYAAVTAPWGHGVPLNRAGEVCMASQVTVWSTELGLMIPYSFELFLHHIVCLVVAANVVWSPAVHPIRPIYMLFATQLGDLPPCGILLLKMTGRRPGSSRLLYGFTLATTAWILGSKVTSGIWATLNSLTNPLSVPDWIWAFCILFWVAYCILTAYKNLKWLQLIRKNPLRPYSLTVAHRISVPISRVVLGFGFGATILSTFIVYGINHDEALAPDDLKTLAILSFLGAALGLTSAMGLRVVLPVKAPKTDPWGRDVYLQYAMLVVGLWAYSGTSLAPGVGNSTFLAALALNVPLFQAVAKASHYLSARDAATRYFPPEADLDDEKPIPAAPEMAQLPKHVVKAHVGMARFNFTIYFVSMALLSCKYLSIVEAGRLALGASLLSQLLRSPGMIYESLKHSSSMATFLHALLSCVGAIVELSILIYEAAGRQMRVKDIPFSTMSTDYAVMAGGTIAVGLAAEHLLQTKEKAPRKEKTCTAQPEAKTKSKRSGIMSPSVFTCLSTAATQVIIGIEVMRYTDQPLPEPGVGFDNFRAVVKSPEVWAAIMAAGCMPTLLLKMMDVDMFRAAHSEAPSAAAEEEM